MIILHIIYIYINNNNIYIYILFIYNTIKSFPPQHVAFADMYLVIKHDPKLTQPVAELQTIYTLFRFAFLAYCSFFFLPQGPGN